MRSRRRRMRSFYIMMMVWMGFPYQQTHRARVSDMKCTYRNWTKWKSKFEMEYRWGLR